MSKTSNKSTTPTSTRTLSLAARQLVHQMRSLPSPEHSAASNDEPVEIPDTADHAYWAYEQLRNAVEYQEQHLLMRSSINRFLTRTFNNEQTKTQALGYEVIHELTKARYLANGAVMQSTVELLDARIENYRQLYIAAKPSFADEQYLFDTLVGIVSADVQHILLPNAAQDALIDFTYHSFQEHIDVEERLENDDAIALYAAVQTALLKSDTPTIRYYMFQNQFPQWNKNKQSIKLAAKHLKQFIDTTDNATQGRRAHAISRMVRTRIAPYIILYHTLQDSTRPETLLTHPEKVSSLAAQVAEEQYKKARTRLGASVIRAIIFLFLTKMMIALLFEVPYELYALGELHWVPLAINLMFPPLYMLLIGLTIKTPRSRNTDQIMHDLRAVLYQNGKLRYSPARNIGGNSSLGITFNFVYALCSLAVFIGICYLLYLLQFNFVSGIIFFIFLSTVSFFGYRISQSVRELVIVERRNFFDMLWGVIMTPFIRLGQWLSDRYSRINVFMLVLDLIIETPYKTLLRFYEQWINFLREKQDDVLK